MNESVNDRKALLERFSTLVEDNNGLSCLEEIKSIKQEFKKSTALIQLEARKQYMEGDGDPALFKVPVDDLDKQFSQLVSLHNRAAKALKDEVISQQQERFESSKAIIAEIEALVELEDSLESKFSKFIAFESELNKESDLGRSQENEILEQFCVVRDRLFKECNFGSEIAGDYFARTLEVKLDIIKKAEAMLESDDVVAASNSVPQFKSLWYRAGVGAGDNDLEDRFSVVISAINLKHQQFFEAKKEAVNNNCLAKEALCKQAEEIASKKYSTIKDLNKASEVMMKLQQDWREVGYVKKVDSDRLWSLFRTANDTFFNAKKQFLAERKAEFNVNYKAKVVLCEAVEALKDSTDWNSTTNKIIELQKEWKSVGAVARKHSDHLWKRFRAACDHFFNSKENAMGNVKSDQEANLKLKEEIITELKAFELAEDNGANIKALSEFRGRWNEIGHVPFKKKDKVNKEFRELIDAFFKNLSMDENELNLERLKCKLDSIVDQRNSANMLYSEREALSRKLNQLEQEISIVDNNSGFFKNEKAQKLLTSINKKMERLHEQANHLRERISIVDGYINREE